MRVCRGRAPSGASPRSRLSRRGARSWPVGLAARERRQSIQHPDAVGARLGAQGGTDRAPHCREVGRLRRDDDGHLAPLRVVAGHDDRVGETRLLAHDALHLAQAHLQTARHDRVVEAAEHPQRAVVGQLTGVVGAVPALPVVLDGAALRARRVAQVVLGDRGAPELDAAVDDPHVGLADGPAVVHGRRSSRSSRRCA